MAMAATITVAEVDAGLLRAEGAAPAAVGVAVVARSDEAARVAKAVEGLDPALNAHAGIKVDEVLVRKAGMATGATVRAGRLT